MKIESAPEKLQAAVQQASRIAGKNTSLPVLSCLLFSVSKNRLTLRATNLELGIEIHIPVKVFSEGEVAVPAEAVSSLIQNLHGSRAVTLEVKEGHLSVASGANKALLKAVPHEDFPTLPKAPTEHSFSAKASQFSEGLRSVWYCASATSVKPELSSVLVQGIEGSLVFAATDSFRLGEKTIALKGVPEFGQAMIPLRNVQDISKALDASGGDITVALDKHQISFTVGDTYLTSRLIEGSFPDYRQLLPKKSSTEAVLLKQDMANALKVLNIFSDQTHQVTLSLVPAEKTFMVTSRNADLGESEESLEAALSGEPLTVSFNHRYIAESLQSIHSDSVSLRFSGLGKPLLLSGVSEPSFLYLVMPMNR